MDRFEEFVNQSNITDFMINKTSRCNFRRKIKDALISALNNKPYNLGTAVSHVRIILVAYIYPSRLEVSVSA